MKNIFKKVFGFCAALVMAFSLASCGISAKTAEKINVAAAKDEHWTYAEVIEKFGEPTVNSYVAIGSLSGGVVQYYVGYDSMEEVKAALEAGKTVKVLTITFVGDKATDASYEEKTKE